jgi:hypothetical protein
LTAANIEHQGGAPAAELGWEDNEDRIEHNGQLPRLDFGEAELESTERRRRALRRLDDLLGRLERANLAEHRHPPSGVVGELAARGLPDAAVYTIPELIEIVFKTQGLLMAANRSAVRLMDAKEHDWFGPRDGRSSPD